MKQLAKLKAKADIYGLLITALMLTQHTYFNLDAYKNPET